jgi:transposase
VPGKPTFLKIQICESVRSGKNVTQRIVKHVGTARNDMELRVLEKSASLFMEEIFIAKSNGSVLFDARDCVANREPELDKIKKKNSFADMDKVVEIGKTIDGPRDIFAFAAESEGLLGVLPAKEQELLGDLISARITEPASKKKTFENLQSYAGFECSLDKVYRLISKLGKAEVLINKTVFGVARKLFDEAIDLLFFDVTTLYFESWDQDELRDFGFSKDCKFGQVQVTLALATQKDGFPIGYRLFSGNTAEISTLVECVNDWGKHVSLDKVVFVADRGMFSAKNLHMLQESGFLFVVGCPMRKLDKAKEKEILDGRNYKVKAFEYQDTVEVIWCGKFAHSLEWRQKNTSGKMETFKIKGHIVSTYSSKRAFKDKTDRDKLLKKAIDKVTKKSKPAACATALKSLLGNRGHTKFLEVSEASSSKIQVSEEKVANDAKWDGMHGVFTNTDLSELEVLSRYRGLWQIESVFRVSKTNLKMRPIFHFTPERIRGHIALCFLSLVTLKIVEKKLKDQEIKLTLNEIIEETKKVGSTIVQDKASGKKFKIPGKLTAKAADLYRGMGVLRSTKTLKA